MFNVLDLFSGIGGFSLGLERTGGFRTIGFCEIDRKAQAVLKKHWPEVPIYDDVTKFTKEDIYETVDVIVGGFPCQDISYAGRGAGLEGTRSGLWWEFHRIIQETQPKWVIAENVSALRSRGLDQVLRSLSEIGYDAEWHCIPASAVGAKHTRDRIWIIAHPSEQQCDQRFDNRQEGHVLCDQERHAAQSQSERQRRKCGSGQVSEANPPRLLADSGIEGLEGQRTRTSRSSEEIAVSSGCGSIVRSIDSSEFWKIEPDVGRVADGIPGRVDRLKQLGNAVVPQIPEMIGKAILGFAKAKYNIHERTSSK